MRSILLILCVTLAQFAFSSTGDPKDLVGQKANYTVDTNPERTSSMLKGGHVVAEISKYLPGGRDGAAYEVNLNYHFDVALMGLQEGIEARIFDQKFFTPAFIEELRVTGKYESPNFKAEHQGYEDVSTMDHQDYPFSDKVFLYDLKDTNAYSLPALFQSLLAWAAVGDNRADIQDLTVVAHLYAAVPVIGAVQIDMAGKYNGMRIKAGLDYVVAAQ